MDKVHFAAEAGVGLSDGVEVSLCAEGEQLGREGRDPVDLCGKPVRHGELCCQVIADGLRRLDQVADAGAAVQGEDGALPQLEALPEILVRSALMVGVPLV